MAAVKKYQMANINVMNENVDNESLQISMPLPEESSIFKLDSLTSSHNSICTLRSKRRSVSFSDTVQYVWRNDSSQFIYSANASHYNYETTFGEKETSVYMTLFKELPRRQTSAAQATASINKCFQVSPSQSCQISTSLCNPENRRTYDEPCHTVNRTCGSETMLNPTVYFFGKKKTPCKPCKSGMGSYEKETKSTRTETRSSKDKQTQNYQHTTTGLNARGSTDKRGGSTSSTYKAVNVRESMDKKPCPASSGTKGGDMFATISHIQIGPREPCPVHGQEPCKGPKCVANSSTADKVPIKVTSVNNPRRGVFELVIRRMNGAPLARNELMLEWTPPPVRPPCGVPCSTICSPGPCRPVKCRTVCRPSCKPKSSKRRCKKPCRPKPCRVVPCSAGPCKPCRPCKPCDPPFPFKPTPCSPCSTCSPCSPCSSCRPKPCRPCKPCKPCRPCKPDLICPTPRTSIIFKPEKLCKGRSNPCNPCSPCGPFKPPCTTIPCYSCFSCSPCPRGPPCPSSLSCSPCSPCPLSVCDPCKPCRPCKPRKPCGPAPCRRSCCKRKPCRPRPPPKCRPCGPCKPDPCLTSCIPCPPRPCYGPCYRPCAVGRRRPRQHSCPPKIKPHKKRISPCQNRIKSCPVVRCQSQTAPSCTKCCATPSCPPPSCPPPSCPPPRSCKSSCSTCCNL